MCEKDLNKVMQVDEAKLAFQSSITRATSSQEIFQHLEHAAQEWIGVKLFTVMDYVASRNMGRRCYTNDPENYPASGWIALTDNNWFDCVIRNRKIYVANDIDQIALDFADANLIAQLGCESIVNLPLIEDDQVIATVNLLNKAGHFDDKKLEEVRRMMPLAKMAYLASHKLTQQTLTTE